MRIMNNAIHVNISGAGEPALLLHGVPDTAELWNPLIGRIDHRYQCVAPDLPGMYRSDVPDGFRFDFDGYADFVNALVEELDLPTPLTLIIHDWGGIYGMLWACKYPQRVKRIICGSFPFSHLYHWHAWARIWRTPMLGELAMATAVWPLVRLELKRGSRRLSEARMRESFARSRSSRTRDTVLKMYRSADPHRFTHWTSKQAQLAQHVPIDVIWGEDDPYVPTHEALLLQSRSQTLVPDCGHWVPMEAVDEYARLILEGPETSTVAGCKLSDGQGEAEESAQQNVIGVEPG